MAIDWSGLFHAHDGGIGAGSGDACWCGPVVVLFPDPAFGAEVGRGDEAQQIGVQIGRSGNRGGRFERRFAVRLDVVRAVVFRRFIGQRGVGNFGHDLAVMPDAQIAVVGDDADGDGVETPLAEDAEDFVFPALFGHEQHALLRFGEQHFIGGHAGFALRDQIEIDIDADAAAAAHFAGGRGESGRAHVLNRDDGAGLHGFDAGFEQELFEERIAHLDVGALLFRFLGELGAGHGGAVDAVAAGLRAHIDDRIADAGGSRVEDFVLFADAQREDVDQRIAGVAFFEDAFAADRGNAEAVAVVRDAARPRRRGCGDCARIEVRTDRSAANPSPRWAARPW